MKEPEIFDMIIRLNRMNDKLTELIGKIDHQSKSPAQQLAREYVNSETAAKILHVSPRTLAKMRKRDRVPFTKVGRKIVYSCEDLRGVLTGIT